MMVPCFKTSDKDRVHCTGQFHACSLHAAVLQYDDTHRFLTQLHRRRHRCLEDTGGRI